MSFIKSEITQTATFVKVNLQLEDLYDLFEDIFDNSDKHLSYPFEIVTKYGAVYQLHDARVCTHFKYHKKKEQLLVVLTFTEFSQQDKKVRIY